MVLIRYFYKRFLINFFLISIFLTFLFNLIEFFEKLIRVKQAPASVIFSFIVLNLLPSFFENLPISSWLATCMMLKEIHQQREWETIQLLNIKLSSIFHILLVATTLLALGSFMGKEFGTRTLAQRADHLKQERFKQHNQQKLFNQWLALSDKTFCHLNYLDYSSAQGDDLTLLELSDHFTIEKIVSAPHFFINLEKKEVFTPEEIIFYAHTQLHQTTSNITRTVPTFFDQLNLQSSSVTLSQLLHLVIFDKKTLPEHVYQQTLYALLQRALSHLLIIFYALITFGLFFFFPYQNTYRWLAVATPYPFIVLLFMATDSVMQVAQYALVALVPYVILLLITILLYLAIRK